MDQKKHGSDFSHLHGASTRHALAFAGDAVSNAQTKHCAPRKMCLLKAWCLAVPLNGHALVHSQPQFQAESMKRRTALAPLKPLRCAQDLLERKAFSSKVCELSCVLLPWELALHAIWSQNQVAGTASGGEHVTLEQAACKCTVLRPRLRGTLPCFDSLLCHMQVVKVMGILTYGSAALYPEGTCGSCKHNICTVGQHAGRLHCATFRDLRKTDCSDSCRSAQDQSAHIQRIL